MIAAHTKKMIVLRLLSSRMWGTWFRLGKGAGPLYVGGRAVGGEPYQRAFHIVKQTGPGARQDAAAGNQHIVDTGAGILGQDRTGGLAHPPLGAVALDGAADAPSGGEADTDQGRFIVAGARLDDDGPL